MLKSIVQDREEIEMNKITSLEIYYMGERIGRLAMTPDALCAFEYVAEYIKTGVSLSPL